jgi:acyl carrier protein
MPEQTDIQIFENLKVVFERAFGFEGKTLSMNMQPKDVPGWDSLGHVNLGSVIEDVFHTSLSVDDLMEMENIESIVRVLKKKNLAFQLQKN